MTKCKLCKKLISDGAEYCDDCTDKKDLIANESYLDGLLNSVQNNVTKASDIYKKKKEKPDAGSSNIITPSHKEETDFIDSEDLEDFDQYDFMKEFDDPIVISNEELYTIEQNIDNEFLNMNGADDNSIIEDQQESPILDDLLVNLDMAEDSLVDDEDLADKNDIADKVDNVNLTYSEGSTDIDNTVDNEGTTDIDDASDFNALADLFRTDTNDLPADSNKDDGNNSAPENELLDLLNQFNPDNQVEDDLQAISDLLGGISTNNQQEREVPEDVGEVFSEALEAVSSLDDLDQGIQYISNDSSDNVELAKEKKETKKGLFARLFANVEDDINPEEKKSKEEAAAKEARRKKKKTKDKKGQSQAKDEDGEKPSKDKQEETTEDKKLKKAKAKKEKKEKKKIEVLDDDIDEGRINKAGASIVFLVFGILVILLLISTNLFSYSLSIRNATDYFGRQRYTQAYNEVYGIELKDEDIELFDKIMTVMFVNKQLNSYNNYYHMRKFPEALDSLLKGLQRYDKYIELATMLGIKTDLDYVREQIVAELYNVFSLTEEQAISIINSESQAKYSLAVYDVILDNISFYN